MKHLYLPACFLLLTPAFAGAQAISINTDASSPDPSAILDVKSTNKGMLVPRMTTTQRTAIATPATGLLVFDTSTNSFWFFNGTAWSNLAGGGATTFIADTDGNTRVETEAASNENKIRFDVAGNEAMVIDDNGHVGIGTAAPDDQVHVLDPGNNRLTIESTAGTVSGFRSKTSNAEFYSGIQDAQYRIVDNRANADRLVIDSSGNVGIGNYLPSEKLHVANGNIRLDNGEFQSWGPISFHPDVDQSGDDLIRFLDSDGNENVRINSAGFVGIGTNTPTAKLQVENGGVLFQGTTGGTPVSGAGARMMWIPAKKAFRAGEVNGEQWDDSNIGMWSSVGGGYSNAALGGYSFIGGGSINTASGDYSFIGGGYFNTASNTSSSVGGGRLNTASNIFSSVGGGFSNMASGENSFVGGGLLNTASGENSFVGGGLLNTASGNYSFVGGGLFNTASGGRSVVGGGESLLAKSFSEAAFGTCNTDYTPLSTTSFNAADRIFVIGNGTDANNRSNAVTVLKNGNFGIGTDSPGQNLDVRSAGPDLPAIFVLGNSDLSHKLSFFPGRQNDPTPFVQWKDGDPLRFVTDAGGFSEKMRITSGGNVGIGTDTPQSELEVKIPFNTTDTSNGIQLNAGERRWRITVGGDKASNPAYFQLLFKNQAANPYVPYLTVSSTGNLGMGRIPATNRLEVEGEASKTTAGSWVGNSDARLKKNITSLNSHEMLQKLLALQGITYEWNDDKTASKRPTGIQYGFTAQNIQTVFPTLVEEDKLGYLQTAYGTYDAMTVEAIRALNDKIMALEAENVGQKALIDLQKKQLDLQSARLDTQAVQLQQITAALQTAGINLENR